MDSMAKRTIALFALLMTCVVVLMISVYRISSSGGLLEAATRQSSYRLDVAAYRGTIYDCKKQPLTNLEEGKVAAVSPAMEAANALSVVLPKQDMQAVYSQLSEGKPFALKVPKETKAADGLELFPLFRRYPEQPLLPHILGYLDGGGNGVAGIEKAYNDVLAGVGSASVTYQVDALGRVLAGELPEVDNTAYLSAKGVMLTIDSRIQQIALEAGKKYLQKGAVIVAEIPDCSLRAVVSLPDFTPDDVSSVLNDKDAPLINRAFSSYNVGSVFKLVVAAAALEAGCSPEDTYECVGSINVDGADFHCFNGQSHGVVDMSGAIEKSCNCYFVQLAQRVGAKQILQAAKRFGFGSPTELAPGFSSDAGILPSETELELSRALANFSFGQGSLMATPLQITALVNTIASGGEYAQPRLVEGLLDENRLLVQKEQAPAPVRLISSRIAEQIQGYMKASVETGTSLRGKPENGGAGAKTATAETGIKNGDHEVVQAWYAGYYPADRPRYVIVILAEDGEGGGTSCGPVFQQIADEIYNKLPGLL
jgi:penicillin-binding protein 2